MEGMGVGRRREVKLIDVFVPIDMNEVRVVL